MSILLRLETMLHVVFWGRRDGTDFRMHKCKQLSSLFIHIFIVPCDSQPDEKGTDNIHKNCTYNVTRENECIHRKSLYPPFMFKRLLNVVTKSLVLLKNFTLA